MMQGFRHRFSVMYADFEKTPELAKFRRFLGPWSWILNTKVALIESKLKECNDTIADIEGVPRETSVFHVTDFHPGKGIEKNPRLAAVIEDLERSMRDYSKDLVLVHQVANLPEQDNVYARYFARIQGIFKNNVYGPTGEAAARYQEVPSDGDLAALRGFEEDHITNFLLRHAESIYERTYAILSWLFRWPKREDSSPTKYIRLRTVRNIVHYFVALYVPLLLIGTLGLLNSLNSDSERIVALGGVAVVLMWSLILLVPSLKRHDLVAIATAFFAVGGIYIGTKRVGTAEF